MSDSPVASEDLSWTETLSRIPDERSRSAFLSRDPKLQTPEAVQQLFDEVIRLVRVDLRRAYRLAKAAFVAGPSASRRAFTRSGLARAWTRLLPPEQTPVRPQAL